MQKKTPNRSSVIEIIFPRPPKAHPNSLGCWSYASKYICVIRRSPKNVHGTFKLIESLIIKCATLSYANIYLFCVGCFNHFFQWYDLRHCRHRLRSFSIFRSENTPTCGKHPVGRISISCRHLNGDYIVDEPSCSIAAAIKNDKILTEKSLRFDRIADQSPCVGSIKD